MDEKIIVIDRRRDAAHEIAKEALEIQLGSVEDAIALVEDHDFGNPIFTMMIIQEIHFLAGAPKE